MVADLLLPEYDAILRSDLSFFAQRCFANTGNILLIPS
jgi:hypothetical protein